MKDSRVYVIAEIGVNHNGSVELAKEMILAAKKAGADAAKFQTFQATKVASDRAPKAEYQRVTTDVAESQVDMLRRLELSADDHAILVETCREVGVDFLSTPFDRGSVDLLEQLQVPLYKVGSGDVTNIPLLNYVARKHKPIILSTGMSTLSEVALAVEAIQLHNPGSLTLLHCVSQYPAPIDDVNLRAMLSMREAFQLPVGYSDHTVGTDVSVAAVALGASIIEKHFTLDRSLPGPDQASSLNPEEFAQLVHSIRQVSLALGDGVKRPARSELVMREVARRSLVASRDLTAGQVLTEDDIDVKRPGTGISPADLEKVVGLQIRGDIKKDDVLTWSMFC